MSEEITIMEEHNKYKIVNFINKKYSLPEDILSYTELLALTNDVKMSLNKAFYNILKNEEVGCIGDDQIRPEIDRQTKRFIAKLLEKGIYDRTISDYLNENKGFELISKANDDALVQMRKLFIQEVDEYQAGVEDALCKRDASITGMGFSIWSSSFINHAIYAAMEISTVNKQEAAANKEYQREISQLHQSITNRHEGAKKKYIDNVYIPSMEAAITFFAFELLDNYISDLIKNGKMSSETLNYINIDRSNDLLKNLELSPNKEEIIYKAFEACPYNLQVYGEALRYGFMDYATYQTAQYFKQGNNILISLVRNLGEVEYPAKFRINYDVAEKVAEFTKSDVISVLQAKTKDYVDAVVKSYEELAQMLAQEDMVFKMISELKEADILSGDAISKQKACAYVKEIVPQNVWIELTERCGFTTLLDSIASLMPDVENVESINAFNVAIEEKLYCSFEKARLSLKEKITEQKLREEQQRIIEIEQKKEKHRKHVKLVIFLGAFAVILGLGIFLISVYRDAKREHEEKLTSYNIDFASTLLGREFDPDFNMDLSTEEYEFVANEVELFGISGLYNLAYSNIGFEQGIIDMLDWTTTNAVNNMDKFIVGLKEMYGEQYSVDPSFEAFKNTQSTEAYAWMNIGNYKGIICWQNADGTVSIRWIIWIPSKNYESFSVNGLVCSIPDGWGKNRTPNGRILKGEKKEGEEYKGSWFVSYEGQYDSIQSYVKINYQEADAQVFLNNYVETEIEGCDDVLFLDNTDENGKWRAIDYYVLCDESVFNLQYFMYVDSFNEKEMNYLLSLIDFKSYNYNPPKTVDDVINLLVGTYVPGDVDLEHLKMHSPERDDYNLCVDTDGLFYNVPYLDYSDSKVKFGTGEITDIDMSGNDYGNYEIIISIDELPEANVTLNYDYWNDNIFLTTHVDNTLIFYVDYIYR